MNVREWALPVYTILMQMAVGALFVLWVIRWRAGSKYKPGEIDRMIRNPILVIVVTAAVAMTASHFHLSKPFQSFMAVFNFKTSWLSREIVFTSLFFGMLLSLLYLTYFDDKRRNLIAALGWLAILTGSILIYCMARIYLLPTQVAWNSTSVIVSFYVTALTLGAMALACLLLLDLKFAEIQKSSDVELRSQLIKSSLAGLTAIVILLAFANLAITQIQMNLLSQGGQIARTSLKLLLELYSPLLVIRQILLIGASLWFGLVVYRMYRLKIMPQKILVPVYLSCLLILIGEIVGRFLFYATHIRVGL
jgi:anaerobic dimethyl sulfoxide reductase subunit C (anchor subunit)